MPFKYRKVYLAPYNDISKEVEQYLNQYKIQVIAYIDKYKTGGNIIHPENIKNEYDYIFVYSPVYMYEITYVLPKQNLYVVTQLLNEYFFIHYKDIQIRDNYIQNLKNKHVNNRAFVIANGPSLTLNDIEKIRNEITFAANKIWLMFNQTQWRPRYYVVVDKLMMEQNYLEIEAVESKNKLYADFLMTSTQKPLKNGIYFKTDMNATHFDMNKGIYTGPTVVYSMISMAIYMGIKEIYLIGLDHSFIIPKQYKEYQEENKIIISQGEKNHFHKDYIKVGEKVAQPEIESLDEAFHKIHLLAKDKGVKIFNASRQSKLNEFEFVNLDEVI